MCGCGYGYRSCNQREMKRRAEEGQSITQCLESGKVAGGGGKDMGEKGCGRRADQQKQILL